MANQLRVSVRIAFPGAVGVPHDIESDISLGLLERFASQSLATWLSVKPWTAWLSAAGYCGRTPAATSSDRQTSGGQQ
ncbi:hypothetical protein [Micromonospora sp. KLBMP9576]|uniref:hypothetical protein n=1 Tax=Micromonospora sp. KLBMP9576 TaxID=3424769 RepID=UPI003D8D5FAF